MSESSASAEPTPRKRLSGWWYVAVAVALLVGLGLAVLQPVQQIYAIEFLKAEGAFLQSYSHEPIMVLGITVPLIEKPTTCTLPDAGGGSMKIGSRTAEAAWWAEHETLRHDLMSAVSKLPTLNHLLLGKMPVSGKDLRLLRKLPNLKLLWLATIPANSSELTVLKELPNLKRLSLNSSNATDATLIPIAGLDQLTELDLHNTAITDAGIQELRQMPQLIELNLSRTAITDAGIHELRQMPRLQILTLDDTDLTDKGVLELQHFPSLRQVLIRQTRLVRAKAFDELRAAAPGLVVVDDDW